MKAEVKKMLKERGAITLFREEDYEAVKDYMKRCMAKDLPTKEYLNLDPINKAEFIADHIIKLHTLEF